MADDPPISSLPTPVRASIEATNAGDLAAFLATFTPDGAVDDWGRTFTGREPITAWSDAEYIGKNMTLEVLSAEFPDARTVVVKASVGGDGFNGPSTFTYRIDGDEGAAVTLMQIRE
ncbi:nuclear transport factor 2 family protein [Gordonia polyisoprenivorans]|uniref:nuclear transport factor 2 family protein n=1 Tax=Gordonia TaxID=2053 RepID=UPI0009ADCC55|nr:MULTISPECIES: nuclear transport factor 2 family protein [Gordonia]OPX14534.1 polyketide cyclase [Gordonia sp. i37]QUD84449.1 nuclear transport factor 2 family protein [Gordonia polyisoprenivorans]UZF54463.1 nuclear transport factor 2 family protein [Gordonia polyisoprenivorans]